MALNKLVQMLHKIRHEMALFANFAADLDDQGEMRHAQSSPEEIKED